MARGTGLRGRGTGATGCVETHETLPYVLNQWWQHSAGWNGRNDAVLERRVPGVDGELRSSDMASEGLIQTLRISLRDAGHVTLT